VKPEPIWFRPPPPPSRPPAAPARAAVPPVEVIVDGQRVSAPGGSTILDACRARGIDIPTVCFLPTLTPVNVCRVCVVEVTGSRALVPACSRRVEPGMTIQTESERVRVSRRMVLELLARLRARRPLGSDQDELALLKDLGQVMRDASICGLGQTASSAVESAIFRLAITGSRS